MFKIGDRVKIIDFRNANRWFNLSFTAKRKSHIGEIHIITQIYNTKEGKRYILSGTGATTWERNMFDKYIKEVNEL